MSDEVERESARARLGVTRTLACVTLHVGTPGDSESSGAARRMAAYALNQIQNAVRVGDRICPMATSRVAVEFGPVTSEVEPHVFGHRLARALEGTPVAIGAVAPRVTVSVGIATGPQPSGQYGLIRRALSAARAGSSQLARASAAQSRAADSVVTVDQPLKGCSAVSRPGRNFQSIRRRCVYPYARERRRHPGSTATWRASTPRATASPIEQPSRLDILVVDLQVSGSSGPGWATTAAVSLAEGQGFKTAALTAPVDAQLGVAIDEDVADLVVLLLERGRTGQIPVWSSSAWSVAARLTASYHAVGIPVVAVSVGAGAGAVAGCVAQGAAAQFGLDQLRSTLRSLRRAPDSASLQLDDLDLPPGFRALVTLTASERMVLFYLTEGWAAQDIADSLVVSVATVRSHIRSILRKLGVRSQLAAVAIANCREPNQATSAS